MSPARARAQRVIRCVCGQLVRIDRTLADARSDFGSDAPSIDDAQPRLSFADDFGALEQTPNKTASVSSGLYRPPPARSTSGTPLPSVDKPLWYVDLGGNETLQMTIEQLIIARRTGKLGEGALVWRSGMTRWRPVGTLIPAAPSHAPSKAPPVRSKLATPTEPRSYERPLATLEFALEHNDVVGSEQTSALPVTTRRASHAPASRVSSPLSRTPIASRGASQIGPLPVPAPLPGGPRSTPIRAGLPNARSPIPPGASTAAFVAPARAPVRSEGSRPRWLSVAIAVMVCVAASGSGAFVVRALKTHRPPLSPPSSNATQPAPLSVVSPAESASAPSTASRATLEGPAHRPDVVDVESLSVERKPRRPAAKPALLQEPPRTSSDDAGRVEPRIREPASENSKNAELPAAARSNPYTGAEPESGLTEKSAPAPAGSDAPGL
jgi:hypothetical protein